MKTNTFLLTIAILALCLTGCSGGDPADGTTGGNGSADSGGTTGVHQDVPPVTDPGTPIADPGTSTEDSTDPIGSEDAVDIIDYPEPGSVEYWLEIIPGTWKQHPKCITIDTPTKCEVEFEILEFTPGSGDDWDPLASGCLADTQYAIKSDFAGFTLLCLGNTGSITLCSNDDDCVYQAEGALSEEILSEGVCSQKADGMPEVCVRHSDCASVLPGATCTNMNVEYHLKYCAWNLGAGATDCESGGNFSFDYLRVQ